MNFIQQELTKVEIYFLQISAIPYMFYLSWVSCFGETMGTFHIILILSNITLCLAFPYLLYCKYFPMDVAPQGRGKTK
ncbi:hypothetical protein GDO78_013004 [Eleutherodactylus coqui]|uniref:Uncharacterized protein n=1 Tax=Eleutherodactylus coqui TaxID=57060 RepID=A0A8J6EXY7_ELECQ|nr:hypothetical protein GDO78_013004 [Eleutherodactylus coqui]